MDAGFLSKMKDKAKGARDKAATAALMGSLGSMNPFGKKKGLPGMGSFGSLSKGMMGPKGAMGKKGMQSQHFGPANSKLTLIFKILVFAISTFFIGLFAIFSIKKTKGFTTNNILKIVFVTLIFNLSLFGAFMLKVPILDFLISSQINILCFYMILAYSTITTLFSDGMWNAIKTSFNFVKDTTKDPTSIFENGGARFIPIFFFIIPSIVLLYNASQGFGQFLITLVLTVLTATVILWPKDWSVGG
jgi:hypothetical protein